MVTKAAVPSDNSNLRPRSLVMVTGRPSRLRAARRSERDDDRWLDHLPFELEPDLAALDFVGVGTLVQAALAAHLVLEMLHRVGDENLRAGDLRFRQGAVEDLAGGPDERLAGKVFLVAGLLAHQHQVRMAAPFAGDRLGCILIQRTARAGVLGLGQLRQRLDCRNHIELKLGLLRHRGRSWQGSTLTDQRACAPAVRPARRDHPLEHIKKSLYPYCGVPAALL